MLTGGKAVYIAWVLAWVVLLFGHFSVSVYIVYLALKISYLLEQPTLLPLSYWE